MEILVEKPDTAHLETLGVNNWPVWSKEVSTFPWSYNATEVAYILEGEVTVTPSDGGAPVSFGAGDLVTFPTGLACTWQIKKPLRKRYQFAR